MDRRVINQKLESLRSYLHRISENKTSDAEALQVDFDRQDIIALNLERAVQQCINIASHLLSDFDDVGGQSPASLFSDLAIIGN